MMSALVLARGPELVWVSPAQAFNAAWRLGPRALLAGLMMQLLVSQFLQDTFGVVRTYILMGLILGTAVWLAQSRRPSAEVTPT